MVSIITYISSHEDSVYVCVIDVCVDIILLIFALKDSVGEDQMQPVDLASNKHDPEYQGLRNTQAISKQSI